MIRIVTASMILLASTAIADDDSSRAKLTGAWQQTEGSKDLASTWVLKDLGDSMHLTASNGDQKVVEFECNTVGKNWEVKQAGHRATVSLWFNGPKLVELETRGSSTVKRRFAVTGDGDTMDLETIPIVPPGKPEILHFKRVATTVAKQ